MKESTCDFCGAPGTENNSLLSSDKAKICENCVRAAFKIINKKPTSETEENKTLEPVKSLTPREMFEFLNDFIIGQSFAKKTLSVAVYNHYKKINQTEEDEDDTIMDKSNILLVGPTGSGKTLLAQTIAKTLNVPIAITDATSLTEAGYVGEDVENILTRLVQAADGDIAKAEQGIIFIDEIDKIARQGENKSISRDVSGEGVQQALLKIVEGSVVNIPLKGGRKNPDNKDNISIDTSKILFICGGAFEDLIKMKENDKTGMTMGFKTVNEDEEVKEKKIDLKEVRPADVIKYGLIPELVGRLPIIATLDEITEEDMVHILTEPKNSIVKQYIKLFKLEGVQSSFEKEALHLIAKKAIERKTGARGLRGILERTMLDIMFTLPETKEKEIIITSDMIK